MREQKGWLKLCAISCVYVSVSEYVYLCDGVCLRLCFLCMHRCLFAFVNMAVYVIMNMFLCAVCSCVHLRVYACVSECV